VTVNKTSKWIAAALLFLGFRLTAQIPAGYNLQYYDDCGVPDRQPHAINAGCHTFPEGNVDANEQARTVGFGRPDFDVEYTNLNSKIPGLVAITYASEKHNRRVQTLTAGSAPLHGPHELPDGKSERLIFKIPPAAITNGRLTLHFHCVEGPNAVVSIVEYWAQSPGRQELRLTLIPTPTGKLRGLVSGLAYDGIAHARVKLFEEPSGKIIPAVETGGDGYFEVQIDKQTLAGHGTEIRAVVQIDDREASEKIPVERLQFQAPHFQPIAAKVKGVSQPELSLDGTWRLLRSPSEQFYATDLAGSGWSNYDVPGQWLQQGFDIPRHQTAGVARDFSVPPNWAGQRVFLRFEAVHGGADYWLNGKHLGYSENLMTPVEFDVTDSILFGKTNRLALSMKVDTVSETLSFSSDYAFHNLGGIDRSVRLFALPPVHLSKLHHETLFQADYQNATLSLNFDVSNNRHDTVRQLSLHAVLRGSKGRALKAEMALGPIPPGQTNFSWSIPVDHPALWNAEKPILYHLKASLYDHGRLLEEISQDVGFRKVETRNGQLLINGRPVKFAGINRHETDPLTGRAATAKHGYEDARLLREANFNYVRTSHYPPTHEFLDACDKLGMYVEVEAPFCWTRGGRGEDDPSVTRQFLTPAAAMLDFDRDHPSVIIWSLGNESGYGPDGPNHLPANFAAEAELCRKEDPSRPILFNNEWARDGGACDIAVVHYPPFPIEDYTYVKKDPRPILADEYFPPQTFTFADELKINPGLDIINWSTGQNSPQSLWSQIYDSKRVIGGSIWAGIDEEFFFTNAPEKGYGVWGFLDVWRRKKSLWWDTKLIHSPFWIPIRRIDLPPGARTLRIPVENRFAFTDFGEIRIEWSLAGKRGRCKMDLPPASKGELEVPVPPDTKPGSLLVLRAFDNHHELISAHGITVGSAAPILLPEPGSGCPTGNRSGPKIEIEGKTFYLTFDESRGLERFPVLHVTRREEKNVFNPGGVPYAQFPDQSTRVIDSVKLDNRGPAVAMTVHDHYRDFSGTVELLIDNSGCGTVKMDYTYSGVPFNVSEAGLRFLLKPSCNEISWRRKSEWDVYPEDHIGRPEGKAKAHGYLPNGLNRPHTPWYLDENEFGARDFRATKYNIYDASLLNPGGEGVRVLSDGTDNVRACLSTNAVQFHTLLSSPPAQLAKNGHLTATFHIQWVGRN